MEKTCLMLIEEASRGAVYIIGGSIPERSEGKLYNTCIVISPSGDIIGKHRKVHLFDIDIPGKIRFIESETLTPGDSVTIVETEFCKIGIGICYDLRFPELALKMAKEGCKFLVYPGAFNMTTGPAHFELLQRARAIDNQIYVAAISPARDINATYIAWGHSSVCNPWGEVMVTTDEKEDIIYAEINLNRLEEIRKSIPVIKQKRYDVYK